jgi:Rer1 family
VHAAWHRADRSRVLIVQRLARHQVPKALGDLCVTMQLAIYNLNLLLGFITPSVDPELEGPVLPQRSDGEFRPFRRRLPEMKFW